MSTFIEQAWPFVGLCAGICFFYLATLFIKIGDGHQMNNAFIFVFKITSAFFFVVSLLAIYGIKGAEDFEQRDISPLILLLAIFGPIILPNIICLFLKRKKEV